PAPVVARGADARDEVVRERLVEVGRSVDDPDAEVGVRVVRQLRARDRADARADLGVAEVDEAGEVVIEVLGHRRDVTPRPWSADAGDGCSDDSQCRAGSAPLRSGSRRSRLGSTYDTGPASGFRRRSPSRSRLTLRGSDARLVGRP